MIRRLLCGMAVSSLFLAGCSEGVFDDAEPVPLPDGSEDVATAGQPLDVAPAEALVYWGSASGASALCDTPYSIFVAHPTGSAKYPLMIITPGTGQAHDAFELQQLANAAASLGFVAASVAYANSFDHAFGCGGPYEAKARCIYSADLSTRAMRKLCAHKNADCNKGVVTTGVSQGSAMAILAANFDGRVRATVARSAGSKVFEAAGACLASWNTAISKDRLRVINGEMDTLFVDTWMQAPANPWVMNAVTGRSCALLAYDCLSNPNGSGWRRVGTWEVADGYPGHCYFLNTGMTDIGDCLTSPANPQYDPGYLSDSGVSWSRAENLRWLKGFTN